MIKATGCTIEKYASNTESAIVRASLVADTASEVTSIGGVANGIIGIADGTKLSFGSTVLTADGNFGILGSDDNWKF